MRRSLVTSAARLALLALLAPQISGCTVVHESTVSAAPSAEKISGVTTISGRSIPFDPIGATIANGKLYGNGPTGQVVIPLDSVKTVWTKQVSTQKTVGLVLITAAVLAGFVVLANKTAGSGSGAQ